MRRLVIIFCVPLLLLGGCGGIYESCTDAERLLVTGTMGLDYIPGGVRVSCEAGNGNLTGVGQTVEAALESMQHRHTAQRLFVRHTEHMIVGEAAARQGMEDILEYICRSPDMRVDTPVYILQGSEVSELMSRTQGISAIMGGIEENTAGAVSVKASDILGAMLRGEGALVCAVSLSEASEGGATCSAIGSAVIKNYRLCAFLDEGETLGAAFLSDNVKGGSITLTDSRTGTVTLSVTGGGSVVSPVLNDNGELSAIAVDVQVNATVAEADGGVAAGSATYMRRLTELTEEYVSEKINSVLRLSASLGTDITLLGGRLGVGYDISAVLPALETQVRVRAVLSRTNDMRDGM